MLTVALFTEEASFLFKYFTTVGKLSLAMDMLLPASFKWQSRDTIITHKLSGSYSEPSFFMTLVNNFWSFSSSSLAL